MRNSEPNALQISVALAEIDPPVWRRLVVPLSWHLGEPHLAIRAAFNWWNSHLHGCRFGGIRYGSGEDGDGGGFADFWGRRTICQKLHASGPFETKRL
jgi:hypothetical protein